MEDALLERFRVDLDALSDPAQRLGIAVSGGPDSLALLLLAAAARPGAINPSRSIRNRSRRASSIRHPELVSGSIYEKVADVTTMDAETSSA